MRLWNLASQASLETLLDSSRALHNALYARMIDGRTIHLHYQLVEPRLCTAHPDAVISDVDARSAAEVGAFAPIRRLGTRVCDASMVRCGHSFVGILAETATQESRVRQSLATLKRLRLLWLVELAVGLIVVSGETVTGPGIVHVPDVDDLDSRIARQAAASLASLWAESQGGHPAQVAAEAFAAGVHSELIRRRGLPRQMAYMTRTQAADFREELDGLVPLTLVRELAAFWTPTWNRYLFILDSPHDTLPTLAALEGRR